MPEEIKFEVELRDIPAYKEHPQFGKIPVDHNRLYVIFNGGHCGYVAKTPLDAPFICLTNSLGDATVQKIEQEIARIKGVEKLAPRIQAPDMETMTAQDVDEARKSFDETE